MTRQELAREIDLILEKYGHCLSELEIKALNNAKEALEQEPCDASVPEALAMVLLRRAAHTEGEEQ